MNNHGIICKNNNMVIFLLILMFISLILLNHRVKLDVNFSVLGFEYYFCIRIHYFFEILTLYKEDLMKYQKQGKKIRQKNKLEIKKILKEKTNKLALQYFEVERINFKIKIGVGDAFFTSMIVPVLSAISAIALQKYLPKTSKQFLIEPEYNKFFFSTKGVINLSIKLKDLIYLVFIILWNRRKLKNKRELKENKK